jgi:putative SOS response-associated peptidase YedK
MTNPLIEKFYELHPEKKEKPKETKTEIEITDTLKKYLSTNPTSNISVTSNLTSPSVATSTTGITKASNFLIHDIHDTEKTFLQVADKIKQGKAKVGSVSIEHDVMLMGGTKIFFEVYVNN